jgi:hypothetical protein
MIDIARAVAVIIDEEQTRAAVNLQVVIDPNRVRRLGAAAEDVLAGIESERFVHRNGIRAPRRPLETAQDVSAGWEAMGGGIN